jgi:hypothetical protein
VANQIAAWAHTLLMARCMGSVVAWASSATVGVDLSAPVMKVVAVRCTRVSLVAKAVDPCLFFFPGAGSRIGLHHTSAAYSILVITMLLWSLCACRLGTDLLPCDSLRIWAAYFSPLPKA